jgi:hypothetical protein
MTHPPDSPDPDDWQPATSRPGELYTPEGQIRSTRNFASGLFSKDPRRKALRRSMQRTSLLIVAVGVGVVAIVVLLQAIF